MNATEGYFQHGCGAVSASLPGIGPAVSRDPASQALNPAGLVYGDIQVSIDVSFFGPMGTLAGSGASGFLNKAMS